MEAIAGASIVLSLIVIVIAILWILVPFLIMGTNSRLNTLIKQNAELLKKLEAK